MKLKRLFSGLLVAVSIAAFSALCITVSKAETDGDWLYNEQGYGGCYLYGYAGNDTEVTIPYKVNGIKVDSVQIGKGSDDSKENLKNVKKVTFESGYETMGNNTIPGFENVEELIIPDTVTKIESMAFYKREKLKKVQLSASLKTIGNNAFTECSSLESITIPEGVENIEWGAFSNCSGLNSVSLPQSLKKMGEGVFTGCAGLKDENGMVIIRDRLYYMEVPQGVTEITIPDGIKVLEVHLFESNHSIKKVVIPNSVTKIEGRVFDNCSKLEEVIVPDSVTYIGTYAFYDCYSLTKLTIPSSFEHGLNPFRGCKELQDDQGFVVVNGMLCDYLGKEEKVIVPDGVKEIEQACLFNKSFSEIELPDSLTRIADNVFQKCSNLEKIEIPDSVTEIGTSAFSECVSLSDVKLSKDAKKLGYECFKGTTNLKKLTIPEGVEMIGFGAFRDSGIEELNLPASLKELSYLYLNDGVKVTFNGSPEQWAALNGDKYLPENVELTVLNLMPEPTVTNTPTPTIAEATATPVPEVTDKPEPTFTVTPAPEATASATVTATLTPTPEVTAAPTAVPSVTPEAQPSATVTPAVTVTPVPDTFKVGGNTYKIDGKTVTLVKGAKKAKVNIPATVKYQGKKYKVTAIAAGAFKSNKKIKTVTIGKNIRSIGKKAFYKDSKLGKVIIKTKLLKSSKVDKAAFKGLSKSVVFKVPAGKKKAYTKIIAKSVKRYKIS